MATIERVKQAAGDLISVKEAAAILRLSEISVRRYLTQKRLARFKAGGRGRFGRTLVSRAQVLGLIREA